MKKLFKTLAVLAAVAALGFGYVSCSSRDDSSSDSKKTDTTKTDTATEQSADYEGNLWGEKTILHLKADKSYVIEWAGFSKYRGTYTLTGDFTNGTLKLHQTEKFSSSSDKWVAEVEDETITITNGTFVEDGATFTKTSAGTSTTKTDTTKTDSTETDTTKTDTTATAAKEYDIWVTRVGSSSSGSATYTVPDKAKANTLVTIEATKGTIKSITSEEVTVTTVTEGKKYTFTMPEKAVYIKITSTGEEEEATTKTDTTNTSNVNSKYKVGDVLLNDGTVVSYKEGMTFTDEQKKKAVCVLAYFNDKKEPVGLGLHNSDDKYIYQYEWVRDCRDCTKGLNTNFIGIVCTPSPEGEADTATFTGDTDGSDNWAYICSLDPKARADYYPAFDYVNKYAATSGLTGTYASGWYMPSIAELSYIYRNKTTVNAVLEALGGTQIADDSYWSSSQNGNNVSDAWFLRFSDGYLSDYSKNILVVRVCCVRAFSN